MAIIFGRRCFYETTGTQDIQSAVVDLALMGISMGIILTLSKVISQGKATAHTITKLGVVKTVAKAILIIELFCFILLGCICCGPSGDGHT